MRNSALAQSFAKFFLSFLLSAGIGLAFFFSFANFASAQTVTPIPTAPSAYNDFRTPDVDPDVPRNHHTYTQIVIIDVLSALMCQMVGIDPLTPSKQCLGFNPVTNKLGYAQTEFGQPTTPQLGGAVGTMTTLVGGLYTPTVSSSQYMNYLSSNFGIVKSANAAAPTTIDCSKDVQFGYGFCGLQPIFKLWVAMRDFSYALLVIAFIFLGLGVMLRFKADPRTVMNLQNQIPRVIVAILLITFSYAIAGGMVDLMWTVTYAGVNVIASTTDAKVRDGCGQPGDGASLTETATNNLLDNPVSFANRIYLRDCEGVDSGIVNISGRVTDSFIALVLSIIKEITGWDLNAADCGITTLFAGCLIHFGLWLTELIITLIILVTIFIALFRLWFELIKAYITFFIFVILGPIWIVLGLIPGRPLGFEKWFRLIFANLAAFPLVAFILVFARVVVESVQPVVETPVDPTATFVPPLVGNPNATAFGVLLALGAILIAPTIPAMIRERMKVGQGKFGATIAAGLGVATGVAAAPATKAWKNLNRRNSTTGAPEGALAVWRHRAVGRVPGVQASRDRKIASKNAYNDPGTDASGKRKSYGQAYKDNLNAMDRTTLGQKAGTPVKWARNKLRSRGGGGSNTGSGT